MIHSLPGGVMSDNICKHRRGSAAAIEVFDLAVRSVEGHNGKAVVEDLSVVLEPRTQHWNLRKVLLIRLVDNEYRNRPASNASALLQILIRPVFNHIVLV